MIDVRFVRAFDDNYIWLVSAGDPNRVALVDPGDARPVFEALERERLTPSAILITHHHGDHTGGVAQLVQRYRIPVYGPAGERIPERSVAVAEGDTVALHDGALTLRVLDTPGHTRGHVCYVGDGVLFCGDTLFTGGCGRLFEGTPEQMHASLAKLAALPPATRVYCAHEYTLDNLTFARIAEPDNGDVLAWQEEARARRAAGEPTVPSTIERELRANPFLRTAQPALAAAAARHAGRPLPDGAAVFGEVRRWKDAVDRGEE